MPKFPEIAPLDVDDPGDHPIPLKKDPGYWPSLIAWVLLCVAVFGGGLFVMLTGR